MIKKAKYAIITSFDEKDKDLSFFDYQLSLLSAYFKMLKYKLLRNKNKYKKYWLIASTLKDSKGHKLLGHTSTSINLFAGFDKFKIPYTYNKITKDTEYLFVLWTDREDIKKIKELKEKGRIKKVITFPCACKFDYEWQYVIPTLSCVDYALVRTDWVVEDNREHVPQCYMYKIKTWFSDINHRYKNGKINNRILCYYKRVPINNEIEEFIKSLGIECESIVHMHYNLYDYYELLKKTDFVIFFQEYVETYGMAHAECWSFNRPSIVQYNENKYGGKTVPYLCNENGLYFNNLDELKKIISEYKNDPKKFLSKFHPIDFMDNVLSMKKSIKTITDLCEKEV